MKLGIKNIKRGKYFYKKVFVLVWSEDVSVNKRVESTVMWTYVISDFNCQESLGKFMKKYSKKKTKKKIKNLKRV